MKTLLSILTLLVSSISIYAQSAKKEYHESFEAKEITELIVSNQYGMIEVIQGAGDSVKIDAVISVTAKKESKANDLIFYIEVVEQFDEGRLNIRTDFGKDMSISRTFSGVDIAVDYRVELPVGLKLRLINADGNVFMENFDGELNVDLRASNFKANRLKGDFLIKQSGGEFSAEEVDKMVGDFRSTSLMIEEGYDINLTTNGGSYVVKSTEKLYVKSNGGAMRLGEIEHMSGVSVGTKYEIADIGDVLKMNLSRGEINVRNIHFSFSDVDLKTAYTKVGLTFMKGAGYHLELKHNKTMKLDIPSNFKLSEQAGSESGVLLKTGFVGDKKYNAKVMLDLRYGNMFIQ
ncbi:hypothetical protein LJB85_01985 [Porphyromonadaceae bacterium OttesenSCG-928-L07]|nr:hypothetical protein [Porphyromonadaceae bacterium OttesenSCG-928-L07]MDL2252089.1 hypothetical protein [Odoribacter sp. OttesenSCG-928-J03]MDL2330836.1 hypothetical protein [Odoribacter sp. OttesenSCG-928-A06]